MNTLNPISAAVNSVSARDISVKNVDSKAHQQLSDVVVTKGVESIDRAKQERSSSSSLELNVTSSNLNSMAGNIRREDKQMEQMETYIDKMIENTKTIVKHFPPYLLGGSEKVETSNEFNAFKEIIDRLTIPPEVQGHVVGSVQVQSGNEKSSVEIKLPDNEIVADQQIYFGEQGLELPQLPHYATDEQFESALTAAEKARETVSEKRTELAEKAEKLFSEAFFEGNGEVKAHKSYGDELREAEKTEFATEKKSKEVEVEFVKKYSGSITNDNSRMRELLV